MSYSMKRVLPAILASTLAALALGGNAAQAASGLVHGCKEAPWSGAPWGTTGFGPARSASTMTLHSFFEPSTRLVSRNSEGQAASGGSHRPAISADGRFVAFVSLAGNMGVDGTRGQAYVRDVHTGQTRQVSVASDGTPSDRRVDMLALSADGGVVAFTSYATNLSSGLPPSIFSQSHLYVHALQTGQTTRIPLELNDVFHDYYKVFQIALSDSGRFVAFTAESYNTEESQIHVHDRVSGETVLESVSTTGTWGNGHSSDPSISADGGIVAFRSHATDLDAGNTQPYPEDGGWALANVFVRDRVQGETRRISFPEDGTVDGGPSLSADGRHVAFSTVLAAPSAPQGWERAILVHDLQAGLTTQVPMPDDVDEMWGPQLDAEGRHVVFTARERTGPGPFDTTLTVFIHDRQTGEATRVSANRDGGLPNAGSRDAVIGADGRFVAFVSYGTDLLPRGECRFASNRMRVYLRDLGADAE